MNPPPPSQEGGLTAGLVNDGAQPPAGGINSSSSLRSRTHRPQLHIDLNPATDIVEPMTEQHMRTTHPEVGLMQKEQLGSPIARWASERRSKLTVSSARGFGAHSLHFLHWMPRWRISDQGVNDMVAGITVGVVLIAQGVAYGMLTGMPPYYGLYAGLVPAAVYGLLGTSRQMHIGPFALVSLLVAEGVNEVPGIDSEACAHQSGQELTAACQEYVDCCLTMSLMVGLGYIVMWALRLGFVVDLLSDPMMSGLTTAAGCLICTSQVKHLLGLTMIKRGSFLGTWQTVLFNLGSINPLTLCIGVVSLALMLGIAKLNKRLKQSGARVPIPEQLVAVLAATFFVWAGGFSEGGISTDGSANGSSTPDGGAGHPVLILGEVPRGLPTPRVPDTSHWPELLHGSAVVTIVGFSLVIATGKTFAEKHGYEVDPNQELLAVGTANILGGLVCCYPASSSLSRSALANAAGAQTPAFNFFAVCVIVLVLLAFAPALRCLPNATLGAIVILAFKSVIGQVKQVPKLWKLKKVDCAVWLATFLGILLLGVTRGMVLGICSSLLVMLKSETRPPHAVLGRLPTTEVFRNIERYSSATEIAGVLIFRFDSSLHFANKNFFKQLLLRYVGERQLEEQPVRVVVLDMYGVHDIDTSAIKMLKALLEDFGNGSGGGGGSAVTAGGGGFIEVVVAGCKGPVRDILAKGGIISSSMPMMRESELGGRATPPRASFSPRRGEAIRWDELMSQFGTSDSLCQQFVLLKTAVQYAQWRVLSGDRVQIPSGEIVTVPRDAGAKACAGGGGGSGSASQASSPAVAVHPQSDVNPLHAAATAQAPQVDDPDDGHVGEITTL